VQESKLVSSYFCKVICFANLKDLFFKFVFNNIAYM